MTELVYLPAAELARIRLLAVPAETRAAIFAAASRLNALYMIARAGSGHVGSSFSSLDIVSWLFLEVLRLPAESARADQPRDVYFSSKGHDAPGLYAVLIGLGLLNFELLHRLRRLGGLPGHPDVATPQVVTNTGSLGMGVSKARGMVLANRLQERTGNAYVLTGDGELQEGQFWESLQPTANRRLSEITVIVDHNKLQSDTFVSRVSDLGDLEAKLASFGWAVARCDGHDFEALGRGLCDLASVSDRPKILIADTVKGRGVSFMEHTNLPADSRLYRFHSGAPDAETYAQAVQELLANANLLLAEAGAAELSPVRLPYPDHSAPPGAQRLVTAYGQALVEQAQRNPRLVALDGDLALDCGLLPFEERFPDRFIECGIAEQDMVSQAGGLALKGLLPAVHSFACFLAARPNEQIYNNATEQTKILYVASLAGVLPGGPGHSHQSVRDISALASVPGLTMIEPSSEDEVRMALDFAVNRCTESCYLRLVSIPCQVNYSLPPDYRFEVGRGVSLTDGADALLIGYGPVLLPEAVRAAGALAEQGTGLKVVNLPWLNRIDPNWLRRLVDGYRFLFVLDNHYVVGGQGDFLLSRLAQLNLTAPPRTHQFGLRTIPVCGANDEVLRAHQLDADSLAGAIASFMRSEQADPAGAAEQA